jgi:hypothetical protein
LLATLGIARHRLSRSQPDKESFGGGSLGSLIRAIGQMIAVHLFDRIEQVYLRANPGRVRVAQQIESMFLQRLGITRARLPEGRKKPITSKR